MRLYRAVSQTELNDIIDFGAFRQASDSFAYGKWFALNEENAASWGRWFAARDGLAYSVVETEISEQAVSQLVVRQNLDNIGLAVFLTEDQVSGLPILSVSLVLSDT